MERALCLIFAQALGEPAVRPADDFLALGGDSLAAVRLLSRLRRTFQTELSLPDFVAHRSPAALAGLLADRPDIERTAAALLHLHALSAGERRDLARRLACPT
ncbi:phosphopantetheine-binding protein [Rhodoplanes tepidamans]|uniref:phosphopantetheine-binding protein n=1 Tax=Rhodoplanes tepidamans TaxID=200616 RepID=UPI003463018F